MYIDDPTDTLHDSIIAVDVASKKAATPTYWLEVAYQAHRYPQELVDRLKGIGFTDQGVAQVPPIPSYKDTGIDVAFIELDKPGTGIFGMWTPEEAEENLAALKEVFAEFQLSLSPRTVSLEEML